MKQSGINWSAWAPTIVTIVMGFIGTSASIGAYAIHNEHRLTAIETRLDEIKSRTFPAGVAVVPRVDARGDHLETARRRPANEPTQGAK